MDTPDELRKQAEDERAKGTTKAERLEDAADKREEADQAEQEAKE